MSAPTDERPALLDEALQLRPGTWPPVSKSNWTAAVLLHRFLQARSVDILRVRCDERGCFGFTVPGWTLVQVDQWTPAFPCACNFWRVRREYGAMADEYDITDRRHTEELGRKLAE